MRTITSTGAGSETYNRHEKTKKWNTQQGTPPIKMPLSAASLHFSGLTRLAASPDLIKKVMPILALVLSLALAQCGGRSSSGNGGSADSDNDTIADAMDSCPTGELNLASGDETADTADPDMDGCKNSEDVDDDGDNVADAMDNCQYVANAGQIDTDNDGEGNACDADDDNDTVADAMDNCPTGELNAASGDETADTADPDMDGCKNSEDVDDDGDNVADAMDNCQYVANAGQIDTDNDGEGNACDADDDNDTVADAMDNCPTGELNAASGDETADTADPDMDGCKNSEDVDDDGDNVADAMDNCQYVANAGQIDTDNDGEGNACDADDDNDTIADAMDSCPTGELNASTGVDTAATADPDDDGCKNSEDVDDDNDGLIELATAQELNNMRNNLAGTTYDDEEDDSSGGDAGSTTGAPISETANCDTATDGVYLCGYELTADIDFSGDGNLATTNDNLDLNGSGTGNEGNFEPIGSDENANTRFTANLHGNGFMISNLDIDRITGTIAADDHTNDAALLASCENTNITNLTLENPMIKGRHKVGALCGIMRSTTLSDVHIVGGAIQGDTSSAVPSSLGGLVGETRGNSQVTGSSASSNVSDIGGEEDTIYDMGGLVGWLHSSQITGSRSSGNVTGGGMGR